MNKKILYVVLAMCGGIAFQSGVINAVNGEEEIEGGFVPATARASSQASLLRGQMIIKSILRDKPIRQYDRNEFEDVLLYICRVARNKEYKPKEGSAEINFSVSDAGHKLFKWVHNWATKSRSPQVIQKSDDSVTITITPERFGAQDQFSGMRTATVSKIDAPASIMLKMSKERSPSGSWAGSWWQRPAAVPAENLFNITQNDLLGTRIPRGAREEGEEPVVATPQTSRMPGASAMEQELDACQKELETCQEKNSKLVKAIEAVRAKYSKLQNAMEEVNPWELTEEERAQAEAGRFAADIEVPSE